MTSKLDNVERELHQLDAMLEGLYKMPEPLYLQPSDIVEVAEQAKRHKESFAPKLKAHLSALFASRWKEEVARRGIYQRQYDTWRASMNKLEKDNNERHLFEELPKHDHSVSLLGQTTSKPVLSNANQPLAASASLGGSRGRSRSALALGGSGDVVRSEEELNQVLLSLLEAERDNPKTRWMSTLAVVPPMRAADPKDPDQHIYADANTLIEDVDNLTLPTDTHLTADGRAWSPVWTEAEERVFVEKYLLYPKNFARIAAFLPVDKTRGACVQYYYRNKKRLRLKQRLQTHRKNPEAASVAGPKKRVGRPPRSQSQQQIPVPIEEEPVAAPGDDLMEVDELDLLGEN